MRACFAAPLAALVLAACAGGAAGRAGARHDPNLITEEELRGTSGSSLHDAIRTLRPAWLLQRRPTTLLGRKEGQLLVYVDRVRFGSAESLRQLRPSAVLTVRYYGPSEAQARFGPGHLDGAIEVTTTAARP